MSSQRTLMTAEELLRLPDDGKRYELLDGELREMAPPGAEHGYISGNVFAALHSLVKPNKLGYLLTNDPGVILHRNPDRVRAPDVCFFPADRFPGRRLPTGYAEVIPDFVAEIVSPGDTAAEVEEKIQEWLGVGVRLVWAVYPRSRSVTAYRSLTSIRAFTESETIDGEPVFPGLSISVQELFS